MKTYTFRIEEEELKKLKFIAEKEERTLSQVVRIAIRKYLKKKDDA